MAGINLWILIYFGFRRSVMPPLPWTQRAVAKGSERRPRSAMTVDMTRLVRPIPVFGSTICEYLMPLSSINCSVSPEVLMAQFEKS